MNYQRALGSLPEIDHLRRPIAGPPLRDILHSIATAIRVSFRPLVQAKEITVGFLPGTGYEGRRKKA
jgi:hypothetical protein